MVRRRQQINLQIQQLLDALLIAGGLLLAHWLRVNVLGDLPLVQRLFAEEIPPLTAFIWMIGVLAPLAPIFLELQGFYKRPLEKTVARSLGQMAGAGLWLALVVAALVIFARLQVPSRSVFLLFMAIAPPLLLLRQSIWQQMTIRALRRGSGGEEVILAGEPGPMEKFVSTLSPVEKLELRIVKRLNLEKAPPAALTEAIHKHSVGRVVLAFEKLDLNTVQHAIELCELEGVEAWLGADFVKTSIARPSFEEIGDRAFLTFRVTPELTYALLAKEWMDRIGAAVGILLLSPFFLLAAVGTKLTSRGPIFFRQLRSGKHGRPFVMYKFRSMVADADTQRAALEPLNEMSGPVFKIERDPRVTPFGTWLRKTSIDEFPQLINVLRGEMSLVGPRPLPVYEVEKFESLSHRRRLSMKPGITCLWQIEGRSRVTSFDEWVQLDLRYIDEWSLGLDLLILVKTVPAVLFRRGAH